VDKTKNNIMKIVILIIFLLLFVLGFTYLRFFIVLFLVCMAVIDLIRKKNMAFTEIALIVLLYFSISPGHFPFLFQSLERMRFMILQNQYENEAEVILKNYLEDVDYQMMEGCNWMLTSHGTVNYQRKEENAVIFFITDYTEVSGYVYYSNQTAFDWMKNCAQIENINDHWMMVQMYE